MFLAVKGEGGGNVWVNALKNEGLWQKSFFKQCTLNEILKICEKWYLLEVKVNPF